MPCHAEKLLKHFLDKKVFSSAFVSTGSESLDSSFLEIRKFCKNEKISFGFLIAKTPANPDFLQISMCLGEQTWFGYKKIAVSAFAVEVDNFENALPICASFVKYLISTIERNSIVSSLEKSLNLEAQNES